MSSKKNIFVGMSEYGIGGVHPRPTGPRKSAQQITKEKKEFQEKLKRADKVRKSGKQVLPMRAR